MIDPVFYTIRLFGREIPLYWYGVIVMAGVIIGTLIAERELRRRGENGERVWDALLFVLPVGLIGARLWFLLNATLGGNRYYIENPIQMLNFRQGGLHIFGGFLFGAVTLLWYLRRNKLDPWLFLDSAGPAVLIGQAVGRIANFINQELYGPPTTLPWGIPIQMEHRLPEFSDPARYPFETTRFHPTFGYEMLWNFAAAGFLLWLSRRYEKDLKPGTIFASWLILAGVGRTWIEFFRPDQPKIPELGISYSALIAALMAVAGAITLMARYKAIQLRIAEGWAETYQLSSMALQPESVGAGKSPAARKTTPRTAKTTKPKARPPAKRAARKTTPKRKTGS
jgi:phosphatidylglycerol:prolipoprotein diacylglycerol transferase